MFPVLLAFWISVSGLVFDCSQLVTNVSFEANPVACVPFSINIEGTWPNHCPPDVAWTYANPNSHAMQVALVSARRPDCNLEPPRPYSLKVQMTAIEAGTYLLYVDGYVTCNEPVAAVQVLTGACKSLFIPVFGART